MLIVKCKIGNPVNLLFDTSYDANSEPCNLSGNHYLASLLSVFGKAQCKFEFCKCVLQDCLQFDQVLTK